jgi:hypothetical protein
MVSYSWCFRDVSVTGSNAVMTKHKIYFMGDFYWKCEVIENGISKGMFWIVYIFFISRGHFLSHHTLMKMMCKQFHTNVKCYHWRATRVGWAQNHSATLLYMTIMTSITLLDIMILQQVSWHWNRVWCNLTVVCAAVFRYVHLCSIARNTVHYCICNISEWEFWSIL